MILIFGGTGLVGTGITKEFVLNKWKVASVGSDDFDVTQFDDLVDFIKQYNPEVIINCAVLNSVEPCEKYPVKAFEINTVFTSKLARICYDNNITLAQISSETVFDGYATKPYVESDIPNPRCIYGVSKYAAELVVQNICSKYYIFRLPICYGKRHGGAPGIVEKIIEWLNTKDKIRMAVDKFDSPSYIGDVAYGIYRTIADIDYGVYHITNSGYTSLYNFATEIAHIIGSDTEIEPANHDEFDEYNLKPRFTALASEKLRDSRSWQDALYGYLKGRNCDYET